MQFRPLSAESCRVQKSPHSIHLPDGQIHLLQTDQQVNEYQLNNGKMQTNLNPLRERLYQELTKSILGNDIIQEEKKKQKLENLYKTFNTTFKRELAPFEINKIEDWLVSGYSVEQILYALRKAQSFGKLSMKNINTYLLQSKIEKDVEEEGYSFHKPNQTKQEEKGVDDAVKILKTPWLK